MPKSLQEKVLDYIQVTGAALEKAEKQAETKQAAEQTVKEMIPGVIETLLRNGRIEPNEKTAAAELLKDPIMVMKLLSKTAEHRNAEEAAQLGTQTTKQASAHVMGSLNSPYVGVRTSGEKESDRVLFERLGLR